MPEFPENNIGAVGSVDERLGLISLVVPYTCPASYVKDAEQIAWCLSFIPNPAPVDVPIIKRSLRQDDSGRYVLELQFDGASNAAQYSFGNVVSAAVYELDASLSKEPIEKHPNLFNLRAKYIGVREASGKIVFIEKLVADGGTQLVANPMFGVDSFLAPGVFWTETTLTPFDPSRTSYDLGTLTSSPPGNPPRFEGRDYWILMRVSAEFRGNIWKLRRSWQLAGPGPVVPEMYEYKLKG